MWFSRIYVELTNICGLNCTFCPDKNNPLKKMDLPFFESIIKQASKYTNEIVCHVMGDPLTLSNITNYLDVIEHYGMKAMITTSGFYLKTHTPNTLLANPVRQLNISLNSFNKNTTTVSFDDYVRDILSLCDEKLQSYPDIFLNLRLWNIDKQNSENDYNEKVFRVLEKHFGIDIHANMEGKKPVRLASKVLLNFDDYFEWPSLSNPIYGDGYCGGLDSHFAILSDGKVVPCCLDYEAVVELGDLKHQSLCEILSSNKACAIKDGFKQNMAVEELCQKCSYKSRFIEA
jgi:radical SAM protein with 4Fe4S-binding SPASM domain